MSVIAAAPSASDRSCFLCLLCRGDRDRDGEGGDEKRAVARAGGRVIGFACGIHTAQSIGDGEEKRVSRGTLMILVVPDGFVSSQRMNQDCLCRVPAARPGGDKFLRKPSVEDCDPLTKKTELQESGFIRPMDA